MSLNHSEIRFRNSLGFRISFWYTLTFSVFLLTALITLYYGVSTLIDNRVDDDLFDDLEEYQILYSKGGLERLRQEIDKEIYSGESESSFVRLLDSDYHEIYTTEQWNSELQAAFFADNPEFLINRFVNNDDGASLNSLNLSKVYILTTGSSASASELVINSLDPYINVIQIGTTTTGKYQASITVYDSDNLGREGANPNHTYAMQPLVLKSLNAYFDKDE